MLDYTEFLLQITVCFLLSACIGIERQYRRRNVGLRTIILVSIGAFLFVRFSFNYPNSDTTRIAAQVVAGIGFLGAGVIIKDNKSVKGLTTAATLWCSAAIGILCSANLLVEAATGTLFILFTNIILRTVNTKIEHLHPDHNYILYSFEIICSENKEQEILKVFKQATKDTDSTINKIKSTEIESGNIKIDINILIKSDDGKVIDSIMKEVPSRKDVISITLSKKDKKDIYFEEEL